MVAFGDVHGAYAELVPLLQRTGVIDAALHWSGGATHLVSLGDLVDRGPDGRATLDLLMRLDDEARRAGGFVHVVLGNHEVMNLSGDLRYVSDADFAKFVDSGASATGGATPDQMSTPGKAERRRAFALDGRYGTWLSDKPLLIVINDTTFVHGGLPVVVGSEPLRAINARFHTELMQAIAEQNPAPPSDLVGERGPLWYRGTARCHALLEADRLRRVLTQLDVRRVVIGHTPTADRRVRSRFGGDVVMLDTGMYPAAFHGRASALVIENGADRVVVAPPEAIEGIGAEPGGYAGDWRPVDAITSALSQAPIESSTKSDESAERAIVLAADTGSIDARFVPLSKQAQQREVAAYRLDRLLELGMVAPAVARTINGRAGVVADATGGWISERQRSTAGTPRPNDCEAGNDYLLMQAFDALIGNAGRNTDNLGYTRALDALRLRDFGGAFGDDALPGKAQSEWPRLPPALRDRLTALDRRTLTNAFGDLLQARQIDALLARRDTIVANWPVLE